MSRTGISLPSPMQLFASANRDHDDEDDDPDEDEEFSRRNENQMESLGLVSEVIHCSFKYLDKLNLGGRTYIVTGKNDLYRN